MERACSSDRPAHVDVGPPDVLVQARRTGQGDAAIELRYPGFLAELEFHRAEVVQSMELGLGVTQSAGELERTRSPDLRAFGVLRVHRETRQVAVGEAEIDPGFELFEHRNGIAPAHSGLGSTTHAPQVIREFPEGAALLVPESRSTIEIESSLPRFERVLELIGEVTLVRVDIEKLRGLPRRGVVDEAKRSFVVRRGLPVRAEQDRSRGSLGRIARQCIRVIRCIGVMHETREVGPARSLLESGQGAAMQLQPTVRRYCALDRESSELVPERHPATDGDQHP
jgi:hypothetical protein